MRRGIVTGPLVLLAANVAVGAVYTLPRVLSERSLAAQAKLLASEVAREKRFIAVQTHRSEVASANERDKEKLYSGTFTELKAGLVPLLTELDRLTRESGLKRGPEMFQTQDVKGAHLVNVAIQAPYQGSYGEIVDFLTRIERSRNFLAVDHIQLSSRSEGSQDLSIVLSAYFLPDGAK